jgi:hypothetical protein
MRDLVQNLLSGNPQLKFFLTTCCDAGKYAMRDLVQKLPSGNPQRDVGTSDDTIAAVLATLNEVIKKHPEFSRYTSRSSFILKGQLRVIQGRSTCH